MATYTEGVDVLSDDIRSLIHRSIPGVIRVHGGARLTLRNTNKRKRHQPLAIGPGEIAAFDRARILFGIDAGGGPLLWPGQ